jgi:hypothetical protein
MSEGGEALEAMPTNYSSKFIFSMGVPYTENEF